MNNTQIKSPVGRLFLLTNQQDIEACFSDHLARPLQLGDVVYCIREFDNLKGVYEYLVVNIRCEETIFAIRGDLTANGPMGQELPYYISAEMKTNLLKGWAVDCSVYVDVANFLRGLAPELYAKRIEALRPGMVLFGQNEQGGSLIPGGVGVVLNLSKAKDPVVTLHTMQDGQPLKVRRKLSTLKSAKVANDPGFREQAPSRQGLWVLGRYAKGTILRMDCPLTLRHPILDIGTSFSMSYLIVDKVLPRSGGLAVTLFDQVGEIIKGKIHVQGLPDCVPMH